MEQTKKSIYFQNIIHFAWYMLLSLIVVSCSKGDDNEEVVEYHLLHITTEEFVDNNTNGVYENYDFCWEEKDKVGVFPIAPKKDGQFTTFYFSQRGLDNNSALFYTFSQDFSAAQYYLVYYPYNERNFAFETHKSIEISYFNQMQYDNNSTRHLQAYDYLFTRSIEPGDKFMEVVAGHVGSLVCLELGNVPDDKLYQSVDISLKSGKELVQNASLDLSKKDGTLYNQKPAESIELRLYNTSTNLLGIAPDNSKLCLHLMMAPQQFGKDSFMVSLNATDGQTICYEFYAPEKFEASKAYCFISK